MAYVAGHARQYIGKSIGNGQFVAFSREAAAMPHTATWTRGELVKENTRIFPGTAITTFDSNGRYGNHTDGRSHVAIYLCQDASGIRVLDQWMGHKRNNDGVSVSEPHLVSERVIRFGAAPPIRE